MSEASAETPQSQPQPPARPLLYPSRIIVFSLLIVALAALGFDQYARFQAREVFNKLDAFVNEDVSSPEAAAAASKACTPSYVREMLGRAPDSEQKANGEIDQTYSWQGVFNQYHILAHFGGAKVVAERPEDSEPLLIRLEQSSNYVWNAPDAAAAPAVE